MKRFLIYGNSGSGKSTLAKGYAHLLNLEHLDLDTISWDSPGIRKEIPESANELRAFMGTHQSWVIEGCYSSLIQEAAIHATKLIFLNPGVEECQKNCKARPWEPHKYESEEDQNKNLEMLLRWVADYDHRKDECSLQAHRELFESYGGFKCELTSNAETENKILR